MEILCPSCEDPTKLVDVTVTTDRIGSHTGRFAGIQEMYVVEDIEASCDCPQTEAWERLVDREAIQAYRGE